MRRRGVLLCLLHALAGPKGSRTIREAGKQGRESVQWRARSLSLHELEPLDDLERKRAER